jgi:YD repeat-containing protein
MAAQNKWNVGDPLNKDKLNQMAGENPSTITYDSQGRVNTVTDDITGVITTISYDNQGRVASYTDGTNTWTPTYDSQGNITNIAIT